MDLTFTQIWLIVGLLFLLIELASVSLVFVFFAIAALLTSILSLTDIIDSLNHQVIFFSVASLASMLLLRKPAKQWLKRSSNGAEYNEYIGETAMVISVIPSVGEGRIFYRGAEWIAISFDQQTIDAGSKVQIKKVDGIKIYVSEVA